MWTTLAWLVWNCDSWDLQKIWHNSPLAVGPWSKALSFLLTSVALGYGSEGLQVNHECVNIVAIMLVIKGSYTAERAKMFCSEVTHTRLTSLLGALHKGWPPSKHLFVTKVMNFPVLSIISSVLFLCLSPKHKFWHNGPSREGLRRD